MTTIHHFIDTNMALVYFLYGLVYFVFGLAIVLQQRALSNFRLASHLWLLAAFGIIHGTMEWGSLFIPVQSEYVSEAWINGLFVTQRIIRIISFCFLLQFAIVMILPKVPRFWGVNVLVRFFAPLWGLFIAVMAVLVLSESPGDSLIRYLLAFPAASMTAIALLLERNSFVGPSFRAARTNLTMTSIAFGLYAVAAGLVVPKSIVWPLSWFNYENVFFSTGFPIQLYRAAIGLAMAFFIIKTLSLFDIEVRNRVERTERNQALLEDRHRIARDLHDGVVQSIFAAGLHLEVANQTLAQGSDEVGPTIQRVKNQLHEVIADIRRYIFDLDHKQTYGGELVLTLKRLLDEFSLSCPTETSLSVSGDEVELSQQQRHDVVLITRECLANVAKHSLASRVELRLDYQTSGIEYILEDNGIGIEIKRGVNTRQHGHGRGLDNIAARAASMGSELSVSSSPDGKGTIVTMWLPYCKAEKEIRVPVVTEPGP
jgi:signal transduction histidine kinase